MTDSPSPQSSQQKMLTPSLNGANALYFSGEDNLHIASMNSAAGVELTIRCRFMQSTGVIVPMVYTHTPNTDRTLKTDNFGAGDGWLLSVDIFASSGAPLVGQCWVRFNVIRGLLGNVRELATLCQGPVTSSQRLAWPGSSIEWTTQRPGFIRSFSGTNPAPGAEWLEVVPTGARWRVITIKTRFDCSVAVATRTPLLQFTDGVNTLYLSEPSATMAASASFHFDAGAGLLKSATVSNTTQTWTLPPMILLAGYTIGSSTGGLQAGDDWIAPQILVEEWLEGA
jgi:hypothetical protein